MMAFSAPPFKCKLVEQFEIWISPFDFSHADYKITSR